MANSWELKVTPKEGGKRCSRVAWLRFPDVSRASVRQLLDRLAVCVLSPGRRGGSQRR